MNTWDADSDREESDPDRDERRGGDAQAESKDVFGDGHGEDLYGDGHGEHVYGDGRGEDCEDGHGEDVYGDGHDEDVYGDGHDEDVYYMRLAVREAKRALAHEDVPIGALLVCGGEVLGSAHNERELRADPTAHAEILALREASGALGSWRLLDCTMYVTLEPCAMCAGAIVLARVSRVVYGATDPKAGACGSVLDVLGEPRLNHHPEVVSGVLAPECGQLLSDFFASRRVS